MGFHVPARNLLAPELFEPGKGPADATLFEIDRDHWAARKLIFYFIATPHGLFEMVDRVIYEPQYGFMRPFRGVMCLDYPIGNTDKDDWVINRTGGDRHIAASIDAEITMVSRVATEYHEANNKVVYAIGDATKVAQIYSQKWGWNNSANTFLCGLHNGNYAYGTNHFGEGNFQTSGISDRFTQATTTQVTRVYYNGVFDVEDTSPNSNINTTTFERLTAGGGNQGNGEAKIQYFALWRDHWSDRKHGHFAADEFGILKPRLGGL